jgi:porin
MNRTALAWSLVFGLTASALLSTSARPDDEVGAKPVALNLGTDATSIVAAADASPAAAGPDAAAAASPQVSLGFASNPRATNSLLGNGQLGRLLGISPDSGVTIGGNVFTGGSWVVSGGAKPGSTAGTAALGLYITVDTEKAFGLPGGEFAAMFSALRGTDVNGDLGAAQMYNTLTTGEPFNRDQLLELWYRQRLFDDKVIIKVGKINGTGIFNAVLTPVVVDKPQLQDWTISGLLYVPVGENPTLFGRLPGTPNTAWGVTATVSPVKQVYVSYGLFDGNNANGLQTGLYAGPHVNTYKFNIGEIGVDWLLGEQEKPGVLAAGVWGQTGNLLTPYLTYEKGANGVYAFGNQRLWFQHPGKDTSGILAFAQYGYTGSRSAEVTEYIGGGLTAVGLVPGRPADSMGGGVAWSKLNRAPYAGLFFFPNVSTSSPSTALRPSEVMTQVYYQAILIPWTMAVTAAYTYVPTPGQRPDLPPANALTLQAVVFF